ncbi:uncharacterized protein [Cicer arietinum]|nr:G patch domain-containing protein 8 isoform X2 [Cicer arietinum]
MDLETENRLAAMLMKEAAELRRQSEKEGVLAYLQKPNVRNRPNSRFLTATVLGVQQANRTVEVNEMWRAREKEMELDKRVAGTSIDKSSGDKRHRDHSSSRSTSASASCSTKKEYEHTPEGLNDEELEEFLHSRMKRGRGAIGPRMDETGPYLPPNPDEEPCTSLDLRERRAIYGPQRPPSLQSDESEEELHEEKRKKSKKSHKSHSDKGHSKKHRSKDKSKHKKKKREEKRSKHHR